MLVKCPSKWTILLGGHGERHLNDVSRAGIGRQSGRHCPRQVVLVTCRHLSSVSFCGQQWPTRLTDLLSPPVTFFFVVNESESVLTNLHKSKVDSLRSLS